MIDNKNHFGMHEDTKTTNALKQGNFFLIQTVLGNAQELELAPKVLDLA